ncbi:Protocadherin Alpha-12 [Manis pentadactyla]|nr:Protocadherin Alpha-12 [Manis pentadactyla]
MPSGRAVFRKEKFISCVITPKLCGGELGPWLLLIGRDRVTRTTEKKKGNLLAYKKRQAGAGARLGAWGMDKGDNVPALKAVPTGRNT